jgi:Amt family ammonium transporter
MCGIFGTLSVGLWATDTGLFYGGGWYQLGVQALGAASAIAFVFPFAMVMFAIIKCTVGLRVSSEIESAGLDLAYHGIESYPEFAGVELHGIQIGDYSATKVESSLN